MVQKESPVIDKQVTEKLAQIGRQVKTLLPDVNARVEINVGRKQPEAIVNVSLTGVTEVRK